MKSWFWIHGQISTSHSTAGCITILNPLSTTIYFGDVACSTTSEYVGFCFVQHIWFRKNGTFNVYIYIYIHRMIMMQTWLGTVVSDCKSLSSGNPISQGCGLLQPPKQLCRHRATLVSGNLTWQWKLPFNGKIICCTYKWMQTCEIFLVEITWRWLVVI